MRVCRDCVFVFAVTHESSVQHVGRVLPPCFVSCVCMYCKTCPWHGHQPRRCRAPWGLCLRTTGNFSMYVNIHPISSPPTLPSHRRSGHEKPESVLCFLSVKTFPHEINDHSAHERVKSLATKKRQKYHMVRSS